jgi:probable HAF family extracellular repeat protein
MSRNLSIHRLVGSAMTFMCLVACSRSGTSGQMLPNANVQSHAQRNSTTSYTVSDLGALTGDSTSELGLSTMNRGGAINKLGQTAGASSNPTADVASLFSNGTVTNLNTLGASVSLANAINDSGQIAGEESISSDPCGCFHAFLYANGKMQNIESSALFPEGSIAYGINKSGQVVGQGFLASSNFHAFLYSNGKMVDLNPLDGYQSIARSINDSGEIVGSSTGSPNIPGGSWLYVNGKITNISKTNTAYFINNGGRIVGENAANHAARYSNGAWTDLGGFSGASATIALGINASGQTIGTALFPTQSYHPFKPGKHVGLIFSNGAVIDLNTLIPSNSGFTITDATAINDSGQIAGVATNPNGNKHAVLLTPK